MSTRKCDKAEQVKRLKTEKLVDQKMIIVAKQKEHLCKVQGTVKYGIQSYAYVAEKSCAGAFIIDGSGKDVV